MKILMFYDKIKTGSKRCKGITAATIYEVSIALHRIKNKTEQRLLALWLECLCYFGSKKLENFLVKSSHVKKKIHAKPVTAIRMVE